MIEQKWQKKYHTFLWTLLAEVEKEVENRILVRVKKNSWNLDQNFHFFQFLIPEYFLVLFYCTVFCTNSRNVTDPRSLLDRCTSVRASVSTEKEKSNIIIVLSFCEYHFCELNTRFQTHLGDKNRKKTKSTVIINQMIIQHVLK